GRLSAARAWCPRAAAPRAGPALPLHDALPISLRVEVNGTLYGQPNAGIDVHFDFIDMIVEAARTRRLSAGTIIGSGTIANRHDRSEEHTSELQSRENLVCRLLLENKNCSAPRS